MKLSTSTLKRKGSLVAFPISTSVLLAALVFDAALLLAAGFEVGAGDDGVGDDEDVALGAAVVLLPSSPLLANISPRRASASMKGLLRPMFK